MPELNIHFRELEKVELKFKRLNEFKKHILALFVLIYNE